MGTSGIGRIDNLRSGLSTSPIGADEPDVDAVGVIQDLLRGHGARELPGPLGAARGRYGPKTTDAVRAFQQRAGLPVTGFVDAPTLNAMIARPAPAPLASHGYLTLVLDLVYSGLIRLVSVTAQFEGGGRFAALNLNTDKKGLSFGVIQWAQRPGRLHEMLNAFRAAQPLLFTQIFGGGDAATADGLLAHTATAGGGTDDDGLTTNPAYNLTNDVWKSRFDAAGLDRDLQKVQIDLARQAFTTSLDKIRAYAPQLHSERAFAFMLDLANQHGDGGAHAIFVKVGSNGMSEADLLAAMTEESVARVAAQYGANSAEAQSTRNRRQTVCSTAILSDGPLA